MLAGLLLAVSLRAAHELVGAGVLPALVRDVGGEAWAGAFFAAYGLAAAAGIVTFGRATDRWRPARALGAALAVFAAGMVGTGLAPSMPAVVAARALEGFGGGGVTVVVSALVMRSYDDAARPRVLAWLSAAWVVPGLLAPGVAVGVAEAFGWRVVFLGLAPGVAIAAALVLPGVGTQRSVARTSAPLARASLLADPTLAGALAVRGLLVFAFFGVESFLPLALATVRGAGPGAVAAVLTLSALGWTAGAFGHARACARWPAPVLARAGAAALVGRDRPRPRRPRRCDTDRRSPWPAGRSPGSAWGWPTRPPPTPRCGPRPPAPRAPPVPPSASPTRWPRPRRRRSGARCWRPRRSRPGSRPRPCSPPSPSPRRWAPRACCRRGAWRWSRSSAWRRSRSKRGARRRRRSRF
jgi:MFS family permease